MNSQLNPNTLLAERCVAHIVFVAKIVYPRGARSGVNKFHTYNNVYIQRRSPLYSIHNYLHLNKSILIRESNIQHYVDFDTTEFKIFL